MLPFAVIQKLHLVTILILEINFLEVVISPCWQRDLHRWGSLPVALGSDTSEVKFLSCSDNLQFAGGDAALHIQQFSQIFVLGYLLLT